MASAAERALQLRMADAAREAFEKEMGPGWNRAYCVTCGLDTELEAISDEVWISVAEAVAKVAHSHPQAKPATGG